MDAHLPDFRSALLRECHTLKRALTDPRFFSGIGGAFADEILHRARLSPLQINANLSDEEVERLWRASRAALAECGAPVQRIVYADRETNYCPGCQTDGRILADRALSRLLRDDWPRTLEELEDVDWSTGNGQNPRRKGPR
ncbi:MAG TPA: hypothetical protein VEY33_12550 [Gemmatimonadota bacterium]|nr:hypothetical protein [Gemmatimonadota bacterium]